MSAWNASVVVANSKAFAGGESITTNIDRLWNPTVCVALDALDALTDDTATISIVGDVGTYEIDSRTLSAVGTYTVEIPQADQVEFTSANGATYSVEVRADPT